jgi:predicted nucleic acid-binding protein
LTKLVVDASVAVHLASLVAAPASLARFECFAPPLMWSESISALLEATFRGALPGVDLDRAVERLERLDIAVAMVDSEHRRRAIQIARSLGWAKSYDAEYVALAQRLGCPLLTVDARLSRGVNNVVQVVGPAWL